MNLKCIDNYKYEHCMDNKIVVQCRPLGKDGMIVLVSCIFYGFPNFMDSCYPIMARIDSGARSLDGS